MNQGKKNTANSITAFKLNDIILYILTIVIVMICFLVPLFLKNENTNSFSVYKNDSLVLIFDCEKDKYAVENEYLGLVDIKEENGEVLITIYTSIEKDNYNTLLVNLADNSVKVIESTCSVRKDCVHTRAIVNGEGVIICLPHGLKIMPTGSNYIPVVTG
ncbi:MAG: NusG domain II-containing protein [Clostridia bacterium]|nr:NusG domain II-containing protein [Clostridia bacterium]